MIGEIGVWQVEKSLIVFLISIPGLAQIFLTAFLLPKIDFFDNMLLLEEKAEKIEGANNFRQVAAFPVFGTGQTTEEGFMKVLEKVKSVHGEEGEKIIWFNMRKVII